MSVFVLSAGGTGGHLFPAQALAGELLARGHRVVIMSDARSKLYGDAFPGTVFETVPAGNFASRTPSRLIAAAVQILAGIFVARRKLSRLRPAAVIGFGGYPTLPVMMAARWLGLPMAIHEQNAVLGRVNRRVAGSVAAVAASLPFARIAPKPGTRIVFTGNPVRPQAAALAGAAYATPGENDPLHVLIFGGSQGARALSAIVPPAFAQMPPRMKARLRLTQQCRQEDIQSVRAIYAEAGIAAELAAFFPDLPARMAASHLVIARSGASTLSELTVIGRPSILIPFPFATDDHQTANAAVLSDAGAAFTFQQKDFDADKLAALLMALFSAPGELALRAAAAAKLGRPDAAKALADLVESLEARR